MPSFFVTRLNTFPATRASRKVFSRDKEPGMGKRQPTPGSDRTTGGNSAPYQFLLTKTNLMASKAMVRLVKGSPVLS